MSDFLENLIIGLTISIISALFFVAYKHPKVFRKYYNYLYVLNIFVYTIEMVHSATKSSVYESFLKKNPNDIIIKNNLEDLNSYTPIFFIIFILISILLMFLDSLRSIIDKAEKQEPK